MTEPIILGRKEVKPSSGSLMVVIKIFTLKLVILANSQSAQRSSAPELLKKIKTDEKTAGGKRIESTLEDASI
jgi:hypothetical protein